MNILDPQGQRPEPPGWSTSPQVQPPQQPGWTTSPYAPPYEPAGTPHEPHGYPAPPAQAGHWPGVGDPRPGRQPGPYRPQVGPARTSSRDVVAVAALALGCAAIAMLGVASAVVSAPAALAGIVAGVVGLGMTRAPGSRGRGLATAGLTTSSVGLVLAGAVFLVTGTGFTSALQGWGWGDDVDLPMVALRPGEPGTVGDYAVTVDEIRMDAGAAPTGGGRDVVEGRYVEAVVTVTYQGGDIGMVDQDLLVSYVGSDDEWIYDEWGCAATTEAPVYEVARLAPGESATFVSCMDVPSPVVDEAAVIVEDLRAFRFTAEMWGTR